MAETVGREVLAVVDLHIRQGSDVPVAFTYSEDDGTGIVVQSFDGWGVRSQVRQKVGGDVWLDFGALMTLADDGEGTLTITGNIPAVVTEDPVWNARASKVRNDELQRSGVWDVELVTAGGVVLPLVAGDVFVDPDVTREVVS